MTPRRKRDVVKEIFGLRPRTSQPPKTPDITATGAATQGPPLTQSPANADSEATILNDQPIQQSSNIQPSKVFTRGESFKRDMASLSVAYLLQESPEIKSLIHLIIVIRDNDPDGQLTAVPESCARFVVQLASALDTHRAEVTQAITKFKETVEKLKITHFNGNGNSIEELTSTIQNDIDNIKPSFIEDEENETGEALSKVLDVTIGPTVDILNLVKNASSLIPVPWVQPLIGTVTSMLQAVSQTRANYGEMRQIAATAGDFVVSCAVLCAGSTVGTTLETSLKKFNKTLRNIAEDCDKLRNLSLFSRYLQQSNHLGDLQGIRKRLDEAIQLFQTENSINIKLDTEELNRKIDLASLANLPSHPRYTRNEYLEKSRDDVLEYLSDWISNAQESVLWVHGAAGLGKSTVAQELVSLLKSEDRLAGGVFLTNLATEPPETVVQMISKQLGEMYPRAVAQIADATRKIQGPHNSLGDYFTNYILDPIRALNYPYPLVIVVDGLDEWRNHEAFLAELVRILSPSPVKFILTSRFNYSIERAVNKMPSHTYPLPPASQQVIERYFRHHFSSDGFNWRGRKPDDARISRLVDRADGLLIWAATARSLIMNKFAPRYPHEILDEILFSEEKTVAGNLNLEERRLHILYHSTLSTLFPPHVRGELRKFLAASLVLQETMAVADFAHLLGISEPATEEIHQRLAALQMQGDPKSDLVSPAMQRFHASFVDFLTTNSDDETFKAVSPEEAHTTLGKKCLDIVFVKFLPSFRGKTCVYSNLRGLELYAVKFWPLHVSSGNMSQPIESSGDERALDVISDEAMLRWAALFLPSISSRLRDARLPLDSNSVQRCALLCDLALMIDEDGVTLPYRIHCLTIATQLESFDLTSRIWKVLGFAYHNLYRQSQLISDLDEAIAAFRRGVEFDPLPDPKSLYTLASALQIRFEHRGSLTDLDEAISLFHQTIDISDPSHPDRPSAFNNLASALQTRFEQRGSPDDLDEAIFFHREALILWPAPHPEYSTSLINLASALKSCFDLRGDLNDLNEAISIYQKADLPQHDVNRCHLLNNLANAFQTRFGQLGNLNDLENAISLHQEALLFRPIPHPDRYISLGNLSTALETRFKLEGAPNDIDNAISLHREALFLKPGSHPHRSGLLNNLASALQSRFEQWAAPSDLDEAISLYHEALLLRPSPHPDRPITLNNLACALITRYAQWCAPNDLDDAILLFRESVDLLPEPHSLLYRVVSNLANAFQSRFGQQGDLNDLDEAISWNQQALLLVQDWPTRHPIYSTLLKHLALGLRLRFDQGQLLDDLTQSIAFYERLLDCPIDDPNRYWSLEQLPGALQERDALIREGNSIVESTNEEGVESLSIAEDHDVEESEHRTASDIEGNAPTVLR